MIWRTTYNQLQSFPPRYNLRRRRHISVNKGYADDIAGIIYWKLTISQTRPWYPYIVLRTTLLESGARLVKPILSGFVQQANIVLTKWQATNTRYTLGFAQSVLGEEHQSEYLSPISYRVSLWLMSYCISPALLLHSTIIKAIYSFDTARLWNCSVYNITRRLSEPTATSFLCQDLHLCKTFYAPT